MILADTSIWIDLLIDPIRLLKKGPEIGDLVTCGPVVQEVLQGFGDSASIGIFRQRLLAFPRLSDPVPIELFLAAAEIYREGRRKGFTIRSATDCLIAAIAIEHNVPVWHRDRDYTHIAAYTTLRQYAWYLT